MNYEQSQAMERAGETGELVFGRGEPEAGAIDAREQEATVPPGNTFAYRLQEFKRILKAPSPIDVQVCSRSFLQELVERIDIASPQEAPPAAGAAQAVALTPIQRDLLRNLGAAVASERSRERGDAWDQLAELLRDLSACAALATTPSPEVAEQQGEYPQGWRALLRESEDNFNRQFGISVSAAWVYRDLEELLGAVSAKPRHKDSDLGEPPPHSLPHWGECAMRVENSDFIAKRVAEGGHGPDADSKLATELHRFIYEYDDADAYRSAWFLHRLELVLEEARLASRAAPHRRLEQERMVPNEHAEHAPKECVCVSEKTKPDDHVWVKCPNGHGEVTHQHFDYCGYCPVCSAMMTSADVPSAILEIPADADKQWNAALDLAIKLLEGR